MKKTIIFLVLLVSVLSLKSQNYTINGYLTDSITGEKLISAIVYESNSQKGATTNINGLYSITLQGGKINVKYSYIGYTSKTLEFNLKSDTVINMNLSSSENLLNEITVLANNTGDFIKKSNMGVVSISPKKINSLPVFMGEKDMLKTLQFTPGVQFGNEGSAGLFVRGGSQEHNLILVDGVTVYNINHLLGFFSVINSDAVSDMKLYKGSVPSRYNGRISSVLDIYLRDGNYKKFKTNISIGILSSSLLLEGPIVKDKSSFIITARRTYFDLLARPFIRSFADGAMVSYSFYDITAKFNTKITNKTKLYFSIFNGNDIGSSKLDENFYDDVNKHNYNVKESTFLKWGNTTSALRFNTILNNKLFNNTQFSYSTFAFSNGQSYSETYQIKPDTLTEAFSYNYLSAIEDYTARSDFEFIPNSNNYIHFGFGSTMHKFKPGVSVNQTSTSQNIDIDTIVSNKITLNNETFLYIEDEIKFNKFINLNFGLNFNTYITNQKVYPNLEPRIALSIIPIEKFSIKASYVRLNQFVHLLSNSTFSFPTDLWVPVTNKIPPSNSNQYSTGIYLSPNPNFEFSVESYYKSMNNLIEYKEGATFFDIKTEWEDKVEIGKGWAYGTEFFIRKDFDKLKTWASYTISWSYRQFENINFGEPYFFRYDKRHNLSLAMIYKKSNKFDFGLTYTMCSGAWTTIPEQEIFAYQQDVDFKYYNFLYNYRQYYTTKNNYRLPLYHRLDVSFNFTKTRKNYIRYWSFGAYNVYNRLNAFYLEQSDNGYNKVCIFPIIPFVSYSIKF